MLVRPLDRAGRHPPQHRVDESLGALRGLVDGLGHCGVGGRPEEVQLIGAETEKVDEPSASTSGLVKNRSTRKSHTAAASGVVP